ncbi:MAG: phage tail protein [Thermoflexales bacterium]|jgi:phage tail-like protein|nr:phage tail protein [Thermoflexales bacterium]
MTSFNRGPVPSGFQERIRSIAQNYKFYLEIGGILVGEFLECGGLVIEREVHEIHEGGVNDFVHKRPGKLKLTNITLKRGLTYDRELWNWCRRGMYDGMVTRKNLSIIIGNSEYLKVKQWDVFGAFPVKWELVSLNASTMEIAWEQIELAHNGFALNDVERTPIGSGLTPLADATLTALAGVARQLPDKDFLAALEARAAAAVAALEALRASEAPDPEELKALTDRADKALAALEAAKGQ